MQTADGAAAHVADGGDPHIAADGLPLLAGEDGAGPPAVEEAGEVGAAAEGGEPGGEAGPAPPEAPRARRAERWPRVDLPGEVGYVRLSCNAQLVWDMRAVCSICEATFTRTCAAPRRGTRPGSRLHGQGRPLGKVFSWGLHASVLGPEHSAESHRAFQPTLADREQARAQALGMGVDLREWLDLERPQDERDSALGEPLNLP